MKPTLTNEIHRIKKTRQELEGKKGRQRPKSEYIDDIKGLLG